MLSNRTQNKVVKYVYGIYDELLRGPGFKALFDRFKNPIGLFSLGFLIFGLIAPLIRVSGYYLQILWFTFFYISLAESWNIIGGYGGEVDFGHVVFVGIGAYTVALSYHFYHFNIWLGAILGGVFAAIFALGIGLPTLRLRGAYFAVTMLAVNESVKIIFEAFSGYTRGGEGVYIGQILKEIPNVQLLNYYAIILTSIFAFLTAHYISYSRLGLALRSIRDSVDGSNASGVEVTKYKLLAFAISAFIAGVAGGLLMINYYQITPAEAFRTETTVEMIIMTLLGGSGTVYGPVIGAIILTPLKPFLVGLFAGITITIFGLRIKLDIVYLLVYGLIFIIVVLFLPRGIVGYLEKKGIIERESLVKYSKLKKR